MKILNHVISLAKIRCLTRIWKGPKIGIEMLTLHFVSMGLICLCLPLQLLPERTTRTSREAINPLPKASVEGKQRKRISQKSEMLPETPYKTFIESDEIKKTSKMKGNAGRQLKLLEAAQKKMRKSKCDKAKTECFHAVYSHIFISLLCGMWRRHSRMTWSSAEAV
jgi:hypothetical protein